MGHVFDASILRAYDVRGVVGKTLHAADAYALGRGFATCVRRAGGGRVVVGHDGRLSSPMLEAALVEGLRAGGVDVVRVGLSSTPMLYHAEQVLEVDGGIQVTGSHNPCEYNGFKLVHRRRSFFGAAIRDLAAAAAAGDWDEGAGGVAEADVVDGYIDRLVAGHGGGAYRIGWDCGNGVSGPVVERLVERLPGEHHLLFTDVDGRFPHHHPDPSDDRNLADLQRVVIDRRLDFGLAFDGDGDRIGAVDGLGRVLRGDQILSILVPSVLAAHPGAAIVADVKSSAAVFDSIAAMGGRAVVAPTGHSLMKEAMVAADAPLGGELSGHIFFGEADGGYDDAHLAAVRLIDAVGRSGASLADFRDAMPALVNTPDLRIPVAEARKFAVVDEVAARLAAAGVQADRTDGARVTGMDGWWLLRASNTEAALTLRAEATDEAGLARLLAEADAQLAASGVVRR